MAYVHAGGGRLIFSPDIIGIFDMDSATVSGTTKDFLNKSQNEGRLIVLTHELPKSFILTGDDMVTLSELMSVTVAARTKSASAGNYEY
ncbi:MAG: DUF370 domain-containing protein [Clostridia bacterium]|nr:DUF370 domain-containing protein [Clostridia bacterium]